MPGFTNYVTSAPDEANEPITRRYYVENLNFNDILKVKVTVFGAPVRIQTTDATAQKQENNTQEQTNTTEPPQT